MHQVTTVSPDKMRGIFYAIFKGQRAHQSLENWLLSDRSGREYYTMIFWYMTPCTLRYIASGISSFHFQCEIQEGGKKILRIVMPVCVAAVKS